jgi:hypothetical protein
MGLPLVATDWYSPATSGRPVVLSYSLTLFGSWIAVRASIAVLLLTAGSVSRDYDGWNRALVLSSHNLHAGGIPRFTFVIPTTVIRFISARPI